MDRVNTMKYDELTLMQYVDGELDESLSAEINEALNNDKEIQSFVEIYQTTRSALISSTQEDAVPDHIVDLIDNYSSEKKENLIVRLVKKNPFKTSVFSAILASLVSMQGTIAILGSGSAMQLADLELGNSQDITNIIQNIDSTDKVYKAASFSNELSDNAISEEFIRVLSENADATQLEFKSSKKVFVSKIKGGFTDEYGNNCKSTTIQNRLAIACEIEKSKWLVKIYQISFDSSQ